jgi:hypothetical protein
MKSNTRHHVLPCNWVKRDEDAMKSLSKEAPQEVRGASAHEEHAPAPDAKKTGKLFASRLPCIRLALRRSEALNQTITGR